MIYTGNFAFVQRQEKFTQSLIEFYVLLTVHLITVFVNNQADAQFFFLCLFIPILYMFRANQLLIIRGVNRINTTSGISHYM